MIKSACSPTTQLPFWKLKSVGRRQTHLVFKSYMLLYADQGSCTFPYQSTVLDIRDVEPGRICFRVLRMDIALIQLVLGVGGCVAGCI